jgi:cobalt-zinc-cadmium efflux system protein
VVVELLYGLRAQSLALVADAGHNFSDVLGLLLAWAAAGLAVRLPTPKRTYGMRRFSILAALGNAILLLIAIGAISWEAIGRLRRPEPVQGGTVMLVAAVGIVVNTITALMFMQGRKHDLNIKGAFLHMAADAAVSAGVVLAGLAISITGWLWLDPITSLLLVVVIAVGTWGLLRDSLNLALDAVPAGIDHLAIERYLATLPGVKEVHDLHIWGMSTTECALTAHLIRPEVCDDDELLLRVYADLEKRFWIKHPTIQIERGHGPTPCRHAPAEVV